MNVASRIFMDAREGIAKTTEAMTPIEWIESERVDVREPAFMK